jgi:hypothetical protein
MRCHFELVDGSPHTYLNCYAPQRRAIACMLPLQRNALRPLFSFRDMQGYPKGATLVEVIGHSESLPPDMRDMLRLNGWVVVSIDDSYARARAAERQR